ncbi:MAG: heme NO-binding domain-containing protein [Hyphomicrobiaceae bacterium]
MYGMVNDAVRTFIVNNHGDEAWNKICDDAGVTTREFEQLLTYDDDITYRLVGAISKHLGADAAQVLEVFGQYWPEYAKGTAVGNLIKFGGECFVDTLQSLDEMHQRVKIAMPDLKPPSFELETISDGNYRLHYFSEREGLAPMVVGLLHGLAVQHQISIEVEHVAKKDTAGGHDMFDIRVMAGQAASDVAA